MILVDGPMGQESLVKDSSIVLASPSMDYVLKLPASALNIKPIGLEKGLSERWRISWQEIQDQVPEDKLQEILKKYDRLNVSWVIGDMQTEALPVLLSL